MKKIICSVILLFILFNLLACVNNSISEKEAISIAYQDAELEISSAQLEKFNTEAIKLDSWYVKEPYRSWDDVWRVIIQTKEGEHLFLYAILAENGKIIEKIRYNEVDKYVVKNK
ncbi:hypothetical protein [Alkaliphilus hydrothermalis]|uniref:Lipoprotein n=1 Tax=Alkaliphilus hydrothermalis TaxID=1482730 RepID=A0ABS2NR89_9FIRM|nr:hypothetical protein [Alkaliphilus hydrothermalis]MBM7615445.1 hypothetical protein [Alkaliphilus hydrothermalis]